MRARQIQFVPKRGDENHRLSYTPADGEFIYVIDTRKIWVGDGKKPGGWYLGTMPKKADYIDRYLRRIKVESRARAIWACRPWYKRIWS